MSLNLSDLRIATNARTNEWLSGLKIESTPIAFSAIELGGEVGELLNEIKKLERERMGMNGVKTNYEAICDEMADVVICTDLLARHFDIDLGEAIRRKFNKTSEKYGFKTTL